MTGLYVSNPIVVSLHIHSDYGVTSAHRKRQAQLAFDQLAILVGFLYPERRQSSNHWGMSCGHNRLAPSNRNKEGCRELSVHQFPISLRPVCFYILWKVCDAEVVFLVQPTLSNGMYDNGFGLPPFCWLGST